MGHMYTVDQANAEAIRRTVADGGEFTGLVELHRHFPLIADGPHARGDRRVDAAGRRNRKHKPT